MPASALTIAAADELGLDLTHHRTVALDAGRIVEADLVLGMTREHARTVVTMEPSAPARTFTFKELVRRGEASPRGLESFGDWLARLAADREPNEWLGASGRDDVADPTGHPLGAFRKTAAEIDDLAARLVRVAWPRPG